MRRLSPERRAAARVYFKARLTVTWAIIDGTPEKELYGLRIIVEELRKRWRNTMSNKERYRR